MPDPPRRTPAPTGLDRFKEKYSSFSFVVSPFTVTDTVCVAVFANGTVLPVALPIVLASVVLLAATVGGLATEGREKAQLRAVFSQYVSRPVVDRILADPTKAKLGGERKELTVLFSDIRGFSNFAEQMPPEELVWRMHFMFGTLSYTLAATDAVQLIAGCKPEDRHDPRLLEDRLTAFLAAGLNAPLEFAVRKAA